MSWNNNFPTMPLNEVFRLSYHSSHKYKIANSKNFGSVARENFEMPKNQVNLLYSQKKRR